MDYALLRGVTLIPEVDIPGHVRSWDKQISEKFVINKNDNAVLDLSKEAAFKYPIEIIKNIIQDFKLDNNGIIHLGGDEVNYNLWNNTDILKFMSSNNLKTFDDLFNYFLITIRNNLPDMYYAYWIEKQEEFNKFSYFSNKDDNQLLYFWGSYKTLKNVITDKKIIITSGDYLYLDCGMSNTRGDITWCEPYKTWKRIFSIDLNLSSLNIIGYQTSLFSELNDENIVSYKIFPRVSALSYRLWNKQIEYNTEQVQKLYVKLIYFNRNLRRRGFEVQHITSGICEREIDICLSKIKA